MCRCSARLSATSTSSSGSSSASPSTTLWWASWVGAGYMHGQLVLSSSQMSHDWLRICLEFILSIHLNLICSRLYNNFIHCAVGLWVFEAKKFQGIRRKNEQGGGGPRIAHQGRGDHLTQVPSGVAMATRAELVVLRKKRGFV